MNSDDIKSAVASHYRYEKQASLIAFEASDGQRLALERLTDDLQKSGKKCMCLIVTHKTEPSEIIDAAHSCVAEYRYKRKWISLNYKITTLELVTRFFGKLETFSR